MNTSSTIQYIYLGLLTLVFGGLTVAIFAPYLGVLLLAAVMAVMFIPVQDYLRKRVGNESIAASLIVLLTLIFVLGPLVFIGLELFDQLRTVVQSWEAGTASDVLQFINTVENSMQQFIPGFTIEITQYLTAIANWLANNVGAILSGTLSATIKILLFIVALFFFLKDGKSFIDWYKRISPLPEEQDHQFLVTLRQTVNSVIRGTFIIAIIQGVVAAVGFMIFGVPNVLVWGVLAAFSAIVPGIGVGLVFIPLTIFMAVTAGLGPAIGLAAWGSVVVGLTDNLLVPYFYSRGLRLHPLFILFSVLGGIALIGPLGFLFGPLVLTVVASLEEVYAASHDASGHPIAE